MLHVRLIALVCGITVGRVQHQLLAEPDLILKKALELAERGTTAAAATPISFINTCNRQTKSNHCQTNVHREQQWIEQFPCSVPLLID